MSKIKELLENYHQIDIIDDGNDSVSINIPKSQRELEYMKMSKDYWSEVENWNIARKFNESLSKFKKVIPRDTISKKEFKDKRLSQLTKTFIIIFCIGINTIFGQVPQKQVIRTPQGIPVGTITQTKNETVLRDKTGLIIIQKK